MADETALDRLLREATLASALNHPNIVTIYETGVVGADRYIAMELGDSHRGLRVIEEGIAAHTITRSALLRPYYFVMFAGALLRSGHFDRAQRALDQSAQVAIETSQHAYDSEHARLQAELHSARGVADAAERSYQDALAISRRQRARWLELRASRGYAHFLVDQGRIAEARDLLAPILQTITEGRDTLDYLYADGLLKTL